MKIRIAWGTFATCCTVVVDVALAVALFSPLAAVAAPSELDTGWADGGAFVLQGGLSSSHAFIQPDGAIVLFIAPGGAIGLSPSGQLDSAFGEGGRIAAPAPELVDGTVAQHPDGSIDVIWRSAVIPHPFGTSECMIVRWERYLPTGRIDPTFSTQEPNTNNCLGGPFVAAHDGSSYLLLSGGTFYGRVELIRHFDPAGMRFGDDVATFYDGTTSTPNWVPRNLAIDAQDRLLVSLTKRDAHEFAISRYVNDGLDAGFGINGIAVATLPGLATATGTLPLADGTVLAYGTVDTGTLIEPAIVHFTGDGQIDVTFGKAGLAILPMARTGESIEYILLSGDPDGRIVVAASVDTFVNGNRVTYTRVGRLRGDGSPDTGFGGAGVSAATYGAGLQLVSVRSSGEIVLALRQSVVQLRGGDLAFEHPLRERRAVEYFNAQYEHYFMTADDPEQVILDTPNSPWIRTGKGFNVFDVDVPPLMPVCRFWSNQSFAPKSSHFYTPYPDECDEVKRSPVWEWEGVAFFAGLPEGATGGRTCSPDTLPLYRAYNNGSSGAPNHRYTTDPDVLDMMIRLGWTMEGEAETRVFACLPQQD